VKSVLPGYKTAVFLLQLYHGWDKIVSET